jgi:hypothetical protein
MTVLPSSGSLGSQASLAVQPHFGMRLKMHTLIALFQGACRRYHKANSTINKRKKNSMWDVRSFSLKDVHRSKFTDVSEEILTYSVI